MADLAAADVTYTKQEGTQKAGPSDPRFTAVFKIAFGDGALTYPSGGIPLTPAKLGCPTNIDEFIVMDADDANGKMYKYNRESGKLRIYNPLGGHTHDFKVMGSQAAAGTDALSAKTLTLGKEAATNITIAGANSATLGGVVAASAAAGDELGNVAIAATVLYAKVVGW